MMFLLWKLFSAKKEDKSVGWYSTNQPTSRIITTEELKRDARISMCLANENYRKIIVSALERNFVYRRELDKKVHYNNWEFYFQSLISLDILLPIKLKKEIAHFIKETNVGIGEYQLKKLKCYTLSEEMRNFFETPELYDYLRRNTDAEFLSKIEDEKIEFLDINNKRKLAEEKAHMYNLKLVQMDFQNILREAGLFGNLEHHGIHNALDFKQADIKQICYDTGISKERLERISRIIAERLAAGGVQ